MNLRDVVIKRHDLQRVIRASLCNSPPHQRVQPGLQLLRRQRCAKL
jgi:hypothetical protein